MFNSLQTTLANRPSYKYWVFGAIAVGTIGSVIDHGSTNVALPTIAGHFNTDIPTVQWVVLAYVLTITALLLPMGKLADIVGRKKVYIIGSLVFAIGAGVSGSSSGLIMLILSRVAQGIGAAMTQGTGMAIITSTFPPSQRGKAIGLIMTVVGTGAVAGPAVGGVLVEALGWPYVFYLNLPIGFLGAATALVVLRLDRPAESTGDSAVFDWLGAALSTGALLTLLMALTNGHRFGWTSPTILATSAGFVALLIAFIWWELRVANPMLDLRLFKRRNLSLGVSAAFFNFLGSSAVLLLMPFYLQGVLGFGPRAAGLMVMPGAMLMAFMGPITGTLSDRFGWRIFTVGGMGSIAAGLFLLSRLTEQSSLALVLPGLMLVSAGQGIFYSPNSSSVLSAVELERYGIVSALLNLVRNGSNIISLAMATAIVTATMGSLGFEPSLDAVRESAQAGVQHAFSVGLRNAFLTMMGLLIIGMAISAIKAEKAQEPAAASPTRAGQNPD